MEKNLTGIQKVPMPRITRFFFFLRGGGLVFQKGQAIGEVKDHCWRDSASLNGTDGLIQYKAPTFVFM